MRIGGRDPVHGAGVAPAVPRSGEALPPSSGTTTPVAVVAAILRDARGRILLSRRTADRDLAGLWEFPGGKVEPGESATDALARELHEELGISIGATTPLIAVPHAYAHKRIRLDVHEVASFEGRARGLEAQALAWVAPERLARYAMPAADRPVVAALLQPDRYLITPEPEADDGEFLARIEAALLDGVRRFQLRVPRVDAARQVRLAQACRTLALRHDAQLLLNGALAEAAALARELGVGLHLTAAQVRGDLAYGDLPLAASCHDADELRLAQERGCEFAVLGPVAPTATHPGASALGWNAFARLREQVALPLYALGGLSRGDLSEARAHGAQGIAAIRGLWPDTPTPR
jgi:8-oxo-dGTP diphosphatase